MPDANASIVLSSIHTGLHLDGHAAVRAQFRRHVIWRVKYGTAAIRISNKTLVDGRVVRAGNGPQASILKGGVLDDTI